jgi:hypothetical protein
LSLLGSFGSLEQEGGEDEDEYTVKNDDGDGEDDDSGMTSNHSRNSLHASREAEGDEIEVVNAILAKHPFNVMKTLISKNSLVSKGGRNFQLTGSDWTEPLNNFMCGVVGLRSCYNKRAKSFVNCACLSELQQFAKAKQYLFRIGSMPKRDQDSVFKELVNGRQYRVRGYTIRMGNLKKKAFHFLSGGMIS